MKTFVRSIALGVLLLAFGVGTSRAQTTMWTFQSDTLGQVLPHIGWTQADIQPVIADDPVNSGQGHNVLENIVHNYNAAPVLMAILPAGKTLADYNKFNFKGYFAKGDVAYKNIIVEAYGSMPTGHAFASPDPDSIGAWDRAQGASTAWENISIPINGSASLTDTVYFAFGINCSGTSGSDTTTWYADSIQLVSEVPPASPTLATPALAATGVPRRATFTWNASMNATEYHLQVATDSAFSSIAFDTTLAGTSQKLSNPLAASTKYFWRVSAIDSVGASPYSTSYFTTGVGIDAVNEAAGVPKEFALYQNYPNPFNPSTIIKYDLPKVSNVSIKVYDAIGREVATLVNGRESAGSYRVTFNMDRFASGVYFVRMIAGSYIHVQKLMLLK